MGRAEFDLVASVIGKSTLSLATKQIPPKDALTLLEWINALLETADSTEKIKSNAFELLVKALSVLLGKILMATDFHSDKRHQRLSTATVKTTRLSLGRALYSQPKEFVSTFMAVCLKDKSVSDLVTLGVLSSSCFDTTIKAPLAYEEFSDSRQNYINMYISVALGSKSPLNQNIANTMSLFFREYALSADELNTFIAPAIARSLLRAPEVVLQHIIPELLRELPTQFDLSEVTEKTLLAAFVGCFSSSKPQIRDMARDSLVVALQKCHANFDALFRKLLDNCKKCTSPDQRILYGQVLSVCTANTIDPSSFLPEIATLIGKESNEDSLSYLTNAYYGLVVRLDSAPQSAIDLMKKGAAEKRMNFRRAYICAYCDHLWEAKKTGEFQPELWQQVVTGITTIKENPLTAIQNKCISALLAYAAIDPSDALCKSIFSPKVTQKLKSEEETKWLIRSLSNSTSFADAEWCHAWYYVCMSSTFPKQQRSNALSSLSELYSSPATPDSVRILLAEQISSDQVMSEFSDLHEVLNIFDKKACPTALRKTLVACHFGNRQVKGGWPALCLRANADARQVLSEAGSEGAVELFNRLLTAPSPEITLAVVESISTMAFVDPSTTGPAVRQFLESNLNADTLTAQDVFIWQSPEGVLVDVEALDKRKKIYAETKRTGKDKDAQEWEDSLRKELEKKKGPVAKKLTKEEQEQLKQQTAIRAAVNELALNIKRALLVVSCLSKNTLENGEEVWFPAAVNLIIKALENKNVSVLASHELCQTFIDMSNRVSPRVDKLLRPLVGVSVLRAKFDDIDAIDAVYKAEPAVALVTRVLYRIKFIGDQSPLNATTIVYVLPLMDQVLHVAMKKGELSEAQDEQLILSLNILSNHNEVLFGINRGSLIEDLISLMQLRVNRAKDIKECLVSLGQGVSSDLSDSETNALVSGTVNGDIFVRTSCLELIDSELTLPETRSEIWVEMFDEEQINRELAEEIWMENKFETSNQLFEDLLKLLASSADDTSSTSRRDSVRAAIARSIAGLVSRLIKAQQIDISSVVSQMIQVFRENMAQDKPKLDKFGLEIKGSMQDPFLARSGILLAFTELAPTFAGNDACVVTLFEFLISEALADGNVSVRSQAQRCGVAVIAKHDFVQSLMPVLESFLAKPDTETDDKVRESVVVYYGALAQHLPERDSRVSVVLTMLVKALQTPSEDVQLAVSRCLPKLVPLMDKSLLKEHISSALDSLLDASTSYAVRRGAAYGLAGYVNGAGISSLADYDIVRKLMQAAEERSNPKGRQGAQFAIECFSRSLGRFFEPYVIKFMPFILQGLGDPTPEVREAASETARTIMRHTSGFGVKQLIPMAVDNLDLHQWRAKKGAVELLGSMAYLDPQQLSQSLSRIVPEIVGVLNDSHKDVRQAANTSLKTFGEVIRNPEIQALVPALVNAIGDPTKYTEVALDGLLKTKFVHFIDAPSLALVVHVLKRALRDRSASTKKKACQIVGNMAILTDAHDIQPYLPLLVSELEVAYVDPVPATRATASKALGSLVQRLGESTFPDLIPRIMDTLRDPERPGDRMGSAQALSEILKGLGVSKLEELLPTILRNCKSPKPWIREGFMPLMLYLPACFGSAMSPYLGQMIPVLLAGLADTIEGIRELSLNAGRRIVRVYSHKAVDLMLPELENGLSDPNWRIRLSSLELTGDLLAQITGTATTSTKDNIAEEAEDEDEEYVSTSGTVSLLADLLGTDRRDRVLAALFVCQSDTAHQVRVAAIEVWKSLVFNTPRTVKEILPALTQIIIKRLASSDHEQRTIAAQTLGELVRRVGGSALSQLLPTLEQGMISSDSDAKQGICIAVIELMKWTNQEVLESAQKTVIDIVRTALVDPNPQVRESGAQAFEAVQEQLPDALATVVPDLISQTASGDETALAALQEMVTTSAGEQVFPGIVSALLQDPTADKARSLAALAGAAGDILWKRLTNIVDSLIKAEVREQSAEIAESLDSILQCTPPQGVDSLMMHVLNKLKESSSAERCAIMNHMNVLFKSSVDISNYVSEWATTLISYLDDGETATEASGALVSLISVSSKETLENLVRPCRHALQLTGVANTNLFAFTLPKGPGCVLPIFIQGLMYGSSDEREAAAQAITDVVGKSPADQLKPFVTQITGPLIRVIGERFPPAVKASILLALNALLAKVPAFLRPFVPQLQRTFAKCLADTTSSAVRERAAEAIGTLIPLQARVDPLVTELIAGARSSDRAVTASMLKALDQVVSKAGQKLSESSQKAIESLVYDSTDKAELTVLANTLGGLAHVQPEAQKAILAKALQSRTIFNVKTINALLKLAPETADQSWQEIYEYFAAGINEVSADIAEASVIGTGKLLLVSDAPLDPEHASQALTTLAEATVKSPSRSAETRRLALVVLRTVFRKKFEQVAPFMGVAIIPLFGCVRDMAIPVKLAAEKAYLSVLRLVDEPEAQYFEKWVEQSKDGLNAQQLRSIQDYTRRVANRLAEQERERIASGGDEETLFSDRIEDENEVMRV